MRNKLAILGLVLLTPGMMVLAQSKSKKAAVSVATPAADTAKAPPAKKPAIPPVAEKVKSSTKTEGLFTLYQDTASGSVQLYIKKDQLDKEYIYQSFSLDGPTALYLNQSMHRSNFVFKVKRSFDKLEFQEVNTDFYYDPLNPISKTANVDRPVAVFYSDKIQGEDSLGYLVTADGLFLSEKMDPIRPQAPPSFFSGLTFNLGSLNTSKSKYAAIHSYPENTDIVVDLAYENPSAFVSGGKDITDPRYVRIKMQHTFIQMPDNNFRSRKDDPRVGFFMTERNDQTSINATPYKDMIHRWNLVKKDPSAELSEPVEPIVFWIENTTPYEYRQTIIDAGLKWNDAFEKAGFKNAVQMRVMPDTATWDPGDIRYNVIRWVASAQPVYGAIGPSFVNPRTGQILGADITVEWYSASAVPISEHLYDGLSTASILQAKNPFALFEENNAGDKEGCVLAQELKSQFATGQTVLEADGASVKDIGEMHKQFLTYLILHEMGHTLGLNHNMKATQMLSPLDVNNKELTRKIGLMGSVMDYPAINVALDRNKQGDYYTTRTGPYDLWAIEYGYKPFSEAGEDDGLNRILSRSNEPQLAFGNDGDDMRSPGKGIDPRVNIFDMSNDVMAYAEDRFKLVNQLMGKMLSKYVKPGQSYAELRARYITLNAQRTNMVNAVSRYVGGVFVDRSFPEQKSTSKPYTPVPLAQQKKAIELINKYIFAPNAFEGDYTLLPYMQWQRRGFNQPATGEDFKETSAMLVTQVSALAQILHPATLTRITNTRLYGNQYSVADVMNDLQKGIFDADINGNVNVQRQYLQSTFVKGMASMLDAPMDEVSKAATRNTLKKIKARLQAATSTNEETKAHRANLIYMIDEAMEVKK